MILEKDVNLDSTRSIHIYVNAYVGTHMKKVYLVGLTMLR